MQDLELTYLRTSNGRHRCVCNERDTYMWKMRHLPDNMVQQPVPFWSLGFELQAGCTPPASADCSSSHPDHGSLWFSIFALWNQFVIKVSKF